MTLKDKIRCALAELTATVQVTEAINSKTHRTYIVRGIADTPEQICQLGWCLLGFIGGTYETDFTIDSAIIGEGDLARDNLTRILKKRLRIDANLTDKQKQLNRYPLLQELVAHTLMLIHRNRPLFPEWLGEIQMLRPPHLSANDPGLDMIAIGSEFGDTFTAIGEVKAYASDPIGGFAKACEKFTQIRQGEYDDEIRGAIKDSEHLAKQQLANSVWIKAGKFGGVVGHDSIDDADLTAPCTEKDVTDQPAERLFFISSPYCRDPNAENHEGGMARFFDKLCDILVELAGSLGE